MTLEQKNKLKDDIIDLISACDEDYALFITTTNARDDFRKHFVEIITVLFEDKK